jgi:hypothetical protein
MIATTIISRIMELLLFLLSLSANIAISIATAKTQSQTGIQLFMKRLQPSNRHRAEPFSS